MRTERPTLIPGLEHLVTQLEESLEEHPTRGSHWPFLETGRTCKSANGYGPNLVDAGFHLFVFRAGVYKE
jgi:hypothetical protein